MAEISRRSQFSYMPEIMPLSRFTENGTCMSFANDDKFESPINSDGMN